MLVPLGVAVLSSKYDEFDCLVFFFCTFLVSLSLVFFWFSSKKKKKNQTTHTHTAPHHTFHASDVVSENEIVVPKK